MAKKKRVNQQKRRKERQIAYVMRKSAAQKSLDSNLHNVPIADLPLSSRQPIESTCETTVTPRLQLQGSLHQGSRFFSENSAGKQCTAMAYVAILYSHAKGTASLCKSDVDSILSLGDNMYCAIPHQQDYLEYT